MVVIKYKKIGIGMFFSHLNLLRLWNRLLSIGDVEVKYSEGFNKTRRLYFSSPTRVGVESECEYIVIDTEEKAKSVKNKLENLLPEWMVIDKVYNVEKKFNIASLNSCARYTVKFDGLQSRREEIQAFFNQTSLVVPVILHGEQKLVDIRNRLYDVQVNDSNIIIKAGVGNESVRLDEVLKQLLKHLRLPVDEYSIVKNKLYLTNENKEFVEIDKVLEELKINK